MCFGTAAGRNTPLCNGDLANNLNRQWNITDSLDLAKGTHSLKFGLDFRRLTPVQVPVATGAFYYWYDEEPFIDGAAPDLIELDQNAANLAMRFHNFSAFGQDTWKASHRLTLTYGVHWDYNPPPVVTSGDAPYALSEITDLASATLLPPGSPLWHASWTNFAPRLGMSYLLAPGAKRPTVVRLGVGQYFDIGTNSAGALTNTQGEFPYSLETILCLSGSGPDCVASFPYTGPEPAFEYAKPYPPMRAFDPHLKLPYSLEWNLAVEQTITPDETFTVTYVGSVGRRLLRDDLTSHPNPTLVDCF